MPRKILEYVVILSCLTLAGVAFWATRVKKILKNELSTLAPDVKFKSFYVTDINNNNITIIGEALVKNNFPSQLIIDSLDYNLYIDNEHILHSSHQKQITITRDGEEKISIPMHLDVQKLKHLVKKFEREKRDSAQYTVKGDYRMKIPIRGMRTFKIDETKTGAAIREINVKAG